MSTLAEVKRIEHYAEDAYNAYGLDAGWKNYQGNPMPAWKDLSPAIRQHWIASASSVIKNSAEDILSTLVEKVKAMHS